MRLAGEVEVPAGVLVHVPRHIALDRRVARVGTAGQALPQMLGVRAEVLKLTPEHPEIARGAGVDTGQRLRRPRLSGQRGQGGAGSRAEQQTPAGEAVVTSA